MSGQFPFILPAHPLIRWLRCLLIVILLGAVPGSSEAGLFYKVEKVIKLTDLNPAASGTIPFSVTGLNTDGRMTGFFPSGNANKLHAFVWDNASKQFLDLNDQLAADSSMATCVNAQGTVAGVFWELGTYVEKGFLFYADGTVSTFTPPNGAGGSIRSVTAINFYGDLIGSYVDANGLTRGYTVQQANTSGVIVDLGDLGQAGFNQYTWPNALNDYGQIVGNAYLLPTAGFGRPQTRGFFWDGGMMLIDASDLSDNWTAISLNSDGQAVGLYALGQNANDVFAKAGSYFWDGQNDTDLGGLGGGAGANAFILLEGGTVVGTSVAADGLLHLFRAVRSNNLFSSFTMTDRGSVSLYNGDESFLPISLTSATIKMPPAVATPDATGSNHPHPKDSGDFIVGFGTDANGNTRSLFWNDTRLYDVVDLMPSYLSFTTISHAYGSRVLINDSRQIACAGTDASGKQMALLLSVDPDTDNDGLPDSWEMQYYGHLGVGKDDLEIGGGGLTNWQAYLQGSNPHDFYNGQPPVLAMVSGNNQTAAPGSFLPASLKVQVTAANGNPIPGGPVTFLVASGGGQVQVSRQASPKTTVSMLTDANGQAQVFFQVSKTAGVTSSVNAVPTGTSPSNLLTFQATADNNGPTNPTPTDPNGPPPAPEEVPVQSYASLDASGSVQGDNNVTMIALDDSNNLAYAFTTPDNRCESYVWSNGTASLAQTFALTGYGHFGAGNGDDIIYPDFVTSTGEVEGTFYGNWPTGKDSYPYPNGTFYASGGVVSAPITVDGIVYADGLALTQTADGQFGTLVQGGFQNFFSENYSLLQIGGANTVFVDELRLGDWPDPPGWRVVGVPDLGGSYQAQFVPGAINRLGWAIGGVGYFPGDVSCLWNGTDLIPLDGQAVALNEQGDVIGYDTAVDGSCSGYLWEGGVKTVLVNHLPAELTGKISNVQPYSLSNQTAPGTDTTVYILAKANVTQPDGTVVNGATIVCTRDNDGDWRFSQLGIPDGTTIRRYTTINSSGVVAGIGSMLSSDDKSSSTQANNVQRVSSRAANGSSASGGPSSPPSSTKQKAALLSPVDISLVFAYSPDPDARDDADFDLSGKRGLRAGDPVITDDHGRLDPYGDVKTYHYSVSGGGGGGKKFWTVQTSANRNSFVQALETVPYVYCGGHGNSGAGVALKNDSKSDDLTANSIKKVGDFMHLRNSRAAIPWREFWQGTNEYPQFDQNAISNNQISINPTNYDVDQSGFSRPMLDATGTRNPARFPNIALPAYNTTYVGVNQPFTLHPGGVDSYHLVQYSINDDGSNGGLMPFLLVDLETDPKPKFAYKIFVLDVCNGARDYSEVFNHGRFVSPANFVRGNTDGPTDFVDALMDGGGIGEILGKLDEETYREGVFTAKNFSH